MPSARRHLRGPLVALVAMVAGLSAASDAAACSTMESGKRACAKACECCTPAASEASPRGIDAVQAGALACTTAPGEGCTCRSGEPATPAPKPARTAAGSRQELAGRSEILPPGSSFTARPTASPQVLATQSPPKIPLYLRIERLLF